MPSENESAQEKEMTRAARFYLSVYSLYQAWTTTEYTPAKEAQVFADRLRLWFETDVTLLLTSALNKISSQPIRLFKSGETHLVCVKDMDGDWQISISKDETVV